MNKWIISITSGLISGLVCYGMIRLGHNPLICMAVGIWAGLTVTAFIMLFRR